MRDALAVLLDSTRFRPDFTTVVLAIVEKGVIENRGDLAGAALYEPEKFCVASIIGAAVYEAVSERNDHSNNETSYTAVIGSDDDEPPLSDLISQMQISSSTLGAAHATAQYELAQAAKRLAADCSDANDLEKIVRAYNEIPPVNLPNDPPFGEFPQDWKPDAE